MQEKQTFTGLTVRPFYGLYVWLVLLSVTLPTLLLLVFTPGELRRRKINRYAARLSFILAGIPITVEGLKNVPAGANIVVANHASYLDGIILTAVLPPDYRFVIKREMTKVPFAHFLLRRTGAEFVDRFEAGRRHADTRRVMQLADKGHSLAFFPEGTFTAAPGLGRFHNGAFKAAVRSKLPVLPVVIMGSRAILPADQWLAIPGRINIVIHPSLSTSDTDLSARTLMAQARETILAELDEPDLATRSSTEGTDITPNNGS
ncbi:MAG: lysophospholipid acyltransferase family protein [Gammaproteobacteria bacterium]